MFKFGSHPPVRGFLDLFQRRWYYKPNDGILPRRVSRSILSNTRRELAKPNSATNSKIVLLPPYVSPGELRILLGVDYKTALTLCDVKLFQHKYFWRDMQGRTFEAENKRRILVQYGSVANAIKMFGFTPVMVDPEPAPVHVRPAGSVPVVFVWGPIDSPPPSLHGSSVPATVLYKAEEVSRSQAGRCAIHADLIIVTGHDRLDDLDWLKKLTEESKLVCIERTPSWESLVTVISDHRFADPPPDEAPSSSPAITHRNETKRTDVLVEAEKPPSVVGVVLDVCKTLQEGTTAEVLVQQGTLHVGQYFVAGSGFGRITNILRADTGESIMHASAGSLVRVGKLIKNEEFTGSYASDDYLFVFPKERAWRLAFHRQRIEWLSTFQTSGDALETAFELDKSGKIEPAAPVRESDDADDDFDAEDIHEKREMSSAERAKNLENERIRQLLHEPRSILVSPVEERAARESAKVVSRWTQRQQDRIESKLESQRLIEAEKSEMKKIRTAVHGSSVDEIVGKLRVPENPLPKSLPVIPLIIKTKSTSQFDQILDELENLESEFNVKIPVVHGGIGPVTPNDLIHAEIESKYSTCGVYALDTIVLPQCASDTVHVTQFDSVNDLVSAVRMRAAKTRTRTGRAEYLGKLKQRR
jgi:hypothetical protein